MLGKKELTGHVRPWRCTVQSSPSSEPHPLPLNEKTLKKLRGWCSSCLVSVTGRTHKEEAVTDSSFDITATIRAQRPKHLGNILRLSDDESVKIVVTKLTKTEDGECPAGSMFMDTPAHADIQQLCDLANDTAGWAKHLFYGTHGTLCK